MYQYVDQYYVTSGNTDLNTVDHPRLGPKGNHSTTAASKTVLTQA